MADQEPLPAGLDIPEELTRRAERLAVIWVAKAEIEARAAERDSQAQAEHAAGARRERGAHGQEAWWQATRAAEHRRAGDRPGQSYRSRLAHHAGHEGFEQSYNAQAAVDTDSMLVVATTLTQAPNDKDQIAPMLAVLATLPAGTGYCRAVGRRQWLLQCCERRALCRGED